MLVKGYKFSFHTDNGVFSKSGLDFGTRSLIEALPQIKGRVLDFGCGYGPIGIIIKKLYDTEVDMIDINKRSIELSKKNSALNNVDVNVFESDIYSNVKGKYNYIITNPPIRVGKEILYKILLDAKDYLLPDGELWLVINKDQGAKSLIKTLGYKYNVKIIGRNKGFFVVLCI